MGADIEARRRRRRLRLHEGYSKRALSCASVQMFCNHQKRRVQVIDLSGIWIHIAASLAAAAAAAVVHEDIEPGPE